MMMTNDMLPYTEPFCYKVPPVQSEPTYLYCLEIDLD